MNLKNKKGFTLVELLAVIVVLAVVMLIAVTAVVPMMERARKQAFITEANTIMKGAKTYFMYKEMTGGTLAKYKVDATTELDCVSINAKNSTEDSLIGEYVDEKGKDDYKGVVLRLYFPGDEWDSPFTAHFIILVNDNYYMMAQDFADDQNNEIPYLASMNDKYIVSKKEIAANETELPEDIDLAWREVFSSLNSCQALNDSEYTFEDFISIIETN